MNSYLLFLLDKIPNNQIKIITPKNSGCQISIKVKSKEKSF